MYRLGRCSRSFKECCSPVRLIFQSSQSFDTVKVYGLSGNVRFGKALLEEGNQKALHSFRVLLNIIFLFIDGILHVIAKKVKLK